MRWMDEVQKGAYDGKINECLKNKISLSVSGNRSRVQNDTFSSGESMICYASSKIEKKKKQTFKVLDALDLQELTKSDQR